MVIVIMGVSGSGKTTVGRLLSQAMDIPFYDADDFHSSANIKKMSSGLPLNDKDRTPWLNILAEKLKTWNRDKGAILACSALKEHYRDKLSAEIKVNWVLLNGDNETLIERIESRQDHFFDEHLLQSQLETLEVPEYALLVDIKTSPQQIVKKIIANFENKDLNDFGLIGLGVMGKNLALNIAENGFQVGVYNRSDNNEKHIVESFIEANNKKGIRGYTDIASFVKNLSRPRKIMLMIKSGTPVDDVINQLIPFLHKGDMILDGGNSHYLDTKRRYETLALSGIHYFGVGISGGEEGARNGPSIMPGGDKSAYNGIKTILETIAAKNNIGSSCCRYIGPEGAGHFVKMVHNGIEYVEMQLLSEMFALLSEQYNYEEIAELFEVWNNGSLNSYLLGITIDILRKKEDDDYVLDNILDMAGNKGTGSWSTNASLELGTTNTMMSAAVFARYVSAVKSDRVAYSKRISETKKQHQSIDLAVLKEAYFFARMLNHHQGFLLINEASKAYNWQLDLSEIAEIWTGGCIIKSKFMLDCQEYLSNSESLLDNVEIFESLMQKEAAAGSILEYGIKSRNALFCFTASYNYWIAMTSEQSSAHLIQAQRDYFGAHTYQRNDKPLHKFFHTNW